MRFEIEYLIRDTSKREIQTHGKYKLLARDESEARSNALPVIAHNEETYRTDCFIEILSCTELTWQEVYGLPDELVAFIDSGVLVHLSEDIQERRVEFLVPALCRPGTTADSEVTYTVKWFHPDNRPDQCDLEGVYIDVGREIEGSGIKSLDEVETAEDLIAFLDEVQTTMPTVICQEPNPYAANFSSRGRIYSVPAAVLDELDRLLDSLTDDRINTPRNKQIDDLRCRLMRESKRIIDPLVWTVEDLVWGEEDTAWPQLLPAPLPDDYDNAKEFVGPMSQINAAIADRTNQLVRERLKNENKESPESE